MSKTVSKFAFTVGIMLAMAFTFSCDSGGGGGDGTGGGSSSSGGGNSSSGGGGGGYTGCSGGGSGSTCINFKTTKIGEQTWMAENLNCDVAGVSKCYADDPACCAKYGRLYDWSTALTACPSGWHLPSDAEWGALVTAVGGSSTAGTKLKATSGWAVNGNGTDDYGFSALPEAGTDAVGRWWNATEYDSNNALGRAMNFYYSYVTGINYPKSDLFSVRCVQD